MAKLPVRRCFTLIHEKLQSLAHILIHHPPVSAFTYIRHVCILGDVGVKFTGACAHVGAAAASLCRSAACVLQRLHVHHHSAPVLPMKRGREGGRRRRRRRGSERQCLSRGVSSWKRVAPPHPSMPPRRRSEEEYPPCLCLSADARINHITPGKMFFLLHMVSLYTLSVLSGASAASHCEYFTPAHLWAPVSWLRAGGCCWVFTPGWCWCCCCCSSFFLPLLQELEAEATVLNRRAEVYLTGSFSQRRVWFGQKLIFPSCFPWCVMWRSSKQVRSSWRTCQVQRALQLRLWHARMFLFLRMLYLQESVFGHDEEKVLSGLSSTVQEAAVIQDPALINTQM